MSECLLGAGARLLICPPADGLCPAGGEDDDYCSGYLRPLLAAVSCLLHRDGSQQASEQVEVHPTGLPVSAVACNELHHVQSHHLLLPQ